MPTPPNYRRILIVDDNEDIHDVFKKILCLGNPSDQAKPRESVKQPSNPGKAPSKTHPSLVINYHIDSAYQGPQALEMVQKATQEGHPYALLFMDIRMPPGWDGVETVKRIWSQFPYTEIVLCTAYADYSSEDILRALDVSHRLLILKKPFDSMTVQQMALALTTKWKFENSARVHIDDLEDAVQTRTQELNDSVRKLTAASNESDLINQELEVQIQKNQHVLKALKKNEEQLKVITHALPVLISYLTPELRFSFVNTAYEKWSGFSAAELLGKPYKDVLDDEALKPAKAQLDIASTTGQLVEFEQERRTKSGQTRSFNITLIPVLNAEGGSNGFIELGYDVSERKKHEQERATLLASEQAALEASRMKSEFLANMSHEIRTPIHGVLGMIGLILDTGLTGEQREFAENIKRSGTSLLTVINDILDFSKVENGKLDFEDLTFDIISTFQDLGKTYSLLAKNKGLQLYLDIDSSLTSYVRGDPGRIRQVATNLIANAIKFTTVGSVTLRLRMISENDESVRLLCEVKDTGIGIPQKTITRLFMPFTQGDASTSRKYGGTGLGLSISKRLVELMDGEIGAESHEGKGSNFWFKITLSKGATTLPDHSDRGKIIDPELTKGIRVLIAEDNGINQVIALRLLEKMGFRADVVNNGKEVLRALTSIPYDMIIMDCHMPEMDGFTTTIQIRNSKTLPRDIPILAMTANAMKEDVEKCMQAGMDDCVVKPISVPKLAAVLEKWSFKIKHKKAKTVSGG